MNAALQIHSIVSMPFEENTYIVWRAGQREAIVIDPGLEPDLILTFLKERGLDVTAILDTHGHADHIAGNEAMKQRYPQAPLIIGAGNAPMLRDADLNLSAPFGMPIISPSADRLVREGDVLDFAGIRLEVLEIPGHSPGHVVFVVRSLISDPPFSERRGEIAPIIVFGGDVLFRGSVGRCDFPGGSMALLESRIRKKLYTMPDDTAVYPGHGPATTVGHEKSTNPFVRS